jgi:hypothetical protein
MLNILDRLPTLELCYEKFLHNKVFADEYMAIPFGKRCLVWFTYENEKHICMILYLNNQNKIIKHEKMVSVFSSSLVVGKGTILYGVIFNTNNKLYTRNNMAVINIHYLEGLNVYKTKYKDKPKLFNTLFNNVSQISLNKYNLILGLPIISNDYSKLISDISSLNYKIVCIKPINLNLYNLNLNFKINVTGNGIGIYNVNGNGNSNRTNQYRNKTTNAITKDICVFNVLADIEPDIYLLTTNDESSFQRTAFIPNYKCSVMMNNIFRNIKENDNLDLLEESDSEDEFENIEDDKFVNINKKIIMECQYNIKFKKWIPNKIVETDKKISNSCDIINIEKKYM